jgi:molecular chaperone HtpG
MEKLEFNVVCVAQGEQTNPVMLTQSEFMRRMREMSSMQPGTSFYGEMPDSYNLVLNTDHPLVKNILADEEANCADSLNPVQADIKGWEARQSDLRAAQNKKKTDEITETEKEDLANTNKRLDELRDRQKAILSEYATGNPHISQLIDLALLGNGLLKGEALSRFIKRSVGIMYV